MVKLSQPIDNMIREIDLLIVIIRMRMLVVVTIVSSIHYFQL